MSSVHFRLYCIDVQTRIVLPRNVSERMAKKSSVMIYTVKRNIKIDLDENEKKNTIEDLSSFKLILS